MNRPINFKLAKWIAEKGYDIPCLDWYHRETKKFNTNNLRFSINKLTDNYAAPTIADIVMWLYEKYGTWISVIELYPNTMSHCFEASIKSKNITISGFGSPDKAYEAAIEYVLKNRDYDNR